MKGLILKKFHYIFSYFIKKNITVYTVVLLVLCCHSASAQKSSKTKVPGTVDVGVARMDITPYGPIRLSGYLRYGARKNESEGVLQQLWAKAIAFGNDAQGPSVVITADLAGIQLHMVRSIANKIAKKRKFNPANLVICTSHTHSGARYGKLPQHVFRSLIAGGPVRQNCTLLDTLEMKLEQVALQALDNRQPSLLAWGQGSVGFALNRRVI